MNRLKIGDIIRLDYHGIKNFHVVRVLGKITKVRQTISADVEILMDGNNEGYRGAINFILQSHDGSIKYRSCPEFELAELFRRE